MRKAPLEMIVTEDQIKRAPDKERDEVVPLPMRAAFWLVLGPPIYLAKWLSDKLLEQFGESKPSQGGQDSGWHRAIGGAFLYLMILFVTFGFGIAVVILVSWTVIVLAVAVWPTHILTITSHPAFIVPAILIAWFLYSLRCTFIGLYALVELVVGVVAMWLAISTTSDSLLVKGLGLMGGIYICVRGLDNLDRTISEKSRYRDIWERWVRGRGLE